MVHNQIDYVIINRNKKQNIRNVRTYAGTETSSDHNLLVMEFESDWVKLYSKVNKNKEATQKRFDTRKLVLDEEIRKEYQDKLSEEAKSERINTWEELGEACKKTAEKVIGYVKSSKDGKVGNEEIKELSLKQKEIRNNMLNEKKADKVIKMREERKGIQKKH